MGYITLGTLNDLQIEIPTQRTENWADRVKDNFVIRVVEHDHTGSGKGRPLGSNSFANDAINGTKFLLNNNESLRSKGVTPASIVNILKVNTSDNIELGAQVEGLSLVPVSADPIAPVEGDIQFSDGTARPAGVWSYDGVSWISAPSALADGSVTLDKIDSNIFFNASLISGKLRPIGDFDLGINKVSDPDVLPKYKGQDVSFSPDGVYLSVAHFSSPYITIYKRDGDTFTKLADPATLPTGPTIGCDFSPDGMYLSVSHFVYPYITIYKRDGDTFTKLANPAILPPQRAYSPEFSPDGVYLSVVHEFSPYITIYKRAGDTFTKLADPATLPTGEAGSTSFSPDGVYLSVAHDTSPYITIYKRAGDTFTKLADPAILPTGNANGTDFSPDGMYLSVSNTISPYITIYKRDGDTFTKLADPAILPRNPSQCVSFSPDGVYMSVGSEYNPVFDGGGIAQAVYVYKRDGDTFTMIANPSTEHILSGGGDIIVGGTAFSPDGIYMSIAHDITPYVTIYKAEVGDNVEGKIPRIIFFGDDT